MEKRVSVLSNTSEGLRASSPQLCLTHWKSESLEVKEGNNYIGELLNIILLRYGIPYVRRPDLHKGPSTHIQFSTCSKVGTQKFL